MKELRILSLVALLVVPLVWTSVQGSGSPTEALNRALASLVLGALPLLAAALFWKEDFHPQTPLIRFGRGRHGPAFRTLLRSLLTLILAACLGVGFAVLKFRGLSDPLLTRDLIATFPVALAAALSVGCLLAAARTWLGKFGLMVFVLLTWLAGQSEFLIRVTLPSGHLQSLLGVGEALPFAPWLSFVALYAMAFLSSALLFLKIPR